MRAAPSLALFGYFFFAVFKFANTTFKGHGYES